MDKARGEAIWVVGVSEDEERVRLVQGAGSPFSQVASELSPFA